MNEKVSPDSFRESMDRCFADIKGNPFLARRIITGEKGEPRMKRKLSFSLVCALAILLALTAIAYAATELIRQAELKFVDSDGKVWTESPVLPEYDRTPGSEEANAILEKYLDNVPDGEIVYAFETDNPGNPYGGYKLKEKHFDSWPAFRQYMEEHNSLLILPSWLPEDMTHFAGVVRWSCLGDRKFNIIEEGQDGPVTYGRYSLDEADSVISEYELVISIPGHQDIDIRSCLTNDDPDWFPLILPVPEGAVPEKVTVSGMPWALLIDSPDPELQDALYMLTEKMDEPTTLKDRPDIGADGDSSWTYVCRTVAAKVFSWDLDREVMFRFFSTN